METWTSYALSDFLMFSPTSYFRRYELANTRLWPGHLLLLAVAAWLWWSIYRPASRFGLSVLLPLAAAWAFVAGWFLHREYAQINLAAEWFALGFALQAALLVALGVSHGYRHRSFEPQRMHSWHPGMLLFVYALLIHPLVGLLAGRPWQSIELFGVAPDPTALATLGILLTSKRTATWSLLPIPIAWCGVSALTYLAMGHAYGIVPLVLSITALVATIALHQRGRSSGHWGEPE
jgi:hypothetical protein